MMTAKTFIETYVHLIDENDLDYLIELSFLNLNKYEWQEFLSYMEAADIDTFDARKNNMSKAIFGAIEEFYLNYPAEDMIEDEQQIIDYIRSQLNHRLGLDNQVIQNLILEAIEELAQ